MVLKVCIKLQKFKGNDVERGIKVDHTTIMRLVHQYSPEIEKKIRKYLKPPNDSWRVDETYIKVLGFQAFCSASKTSKRIEAMNMVKKGQAKDLDYSGLDEVKYINQLLFGIVL